MVVQKESTFFGAQALHSEPLVVLAGFSPNSQVMHTTWVINRELQQTHFPEDAHVAHKKHSAGRRITFPHLTNLHSQTVSYCCTRNNLLFSRSKKTRCNSGKIKHYNSYTQTSVLPWTLVNIAMNNTKSNFYSAFSLPPPAFNSFSYRWTTS